MADPENPPNVELWEKEVSKISEALNSDFANLLNTEMSELKKISLFTESVTEKIQKHYQSIFPKKCSSCSKIFSSREEYIKETQGLNREDIFDEDGLQEYRNCSCGSTLVVWTSHDRRDLTAYGVARRKLFDECLEKLKQISNKTEEELRNDLRKIFRMVSS